jgi:hypothetical protein
MKNQKRRYSSVIKGSPSFSDHTVVKSSKDIDIESAVSIRKIVGNKNEVAKVNAEIKYAPRLYFHEPSTLEMGEFKKILDKMNKDAEKNIFEPKCFTMDDRVRCLVLLK